MSSYRRFFPLALGVLLLGACAAPVQYEYNSAPFEQWHNFAWKPAPIGPVRNPIVDSGILETRVEQAVAATLTEQGYNQVANPAQADFLVTYHTALERRQVYGGSSFGVAYGYGYGWGGWNAPFSTIVINQPIREIREADLIIDVINAKTNTLVWRGWVTNSVSQSNYSQQAVTDAIKRILAKFPPPPPNLLR